MSDPTPPTFDRRRFLASLALSSLGVACAPAARASARPRRLLCFTKSSGFEHSVVKRDPSGGFSIVERAVTELGQRNGFDVLCTKDGSIFTAEGLRDFDAFFFFTTGDLTQPSKDGGLPMPAGGKDALLDAIRGGKGLVGVHSASDTFHSPGPDWGVSPSVDPFITLLGGEFMGHGKQQSARMRVVDPAFPGMNAFPTGAVPRYGEWYSLKNINPDMHVLAVIETEGMEGGVYRRPNYPVVWARQHGRGRVYYTALGHLDTEWTEPAFLHSLSEAVRWAFGERAATLTRNITAVAPGFAQVPAPPAS